MRCKYPDCYCNYDPTYGEPVCEINEGQKFCMFKEGFCPCDWEFNPMHGGIECNACGSFNASLKGRHPSMVGGRDE